MNSHIENEECPRIIGQFINYMKVVIWHQKIGYLRILAKRQNTETSYPDVYEAVEPDEVNYEDTYWEKGFNADVFEHDGLREAFTQLSTKDQTILAMTYMQQFTDAEIATKMNISQRYVRNARYRTTKKLKQLMRGDS